jgi:hypothetical protein
MDREVDATLEQTPRRGYRLLATGIAVTAFACCAGLLCLVLSLSYPSGTGVGTGYEITACAGLVTVPKAQVGVWWQLTMMSRLLPATLSPTAVCATLPWSSRLPAMGEIAFPP